MSVLQCLCGCDPKRICMKTSKTNKRGEQKRPRQVPKIISTRLTSSGCTPLCQPKSQDFQKADRGICLIAQKFVSLSLCVWWNTPDNETAFHHGASSQGLPCCHEDPVKEVALKGHGFLHVAGRSTGTSCSCRVPFHQKKDMFGLCCRVAPVPKASLVKT